MSDAPFARALSSPLPPLPAAPSVPPGGAPSWPPSGPPPPDALPAGQGAEQLSAARRAQGPWAELPAWRRVRAVGRVRRRLLANAEASAELVAGEAGKLAEEVLWHEILPCAEAVRRWRDLLSEGLEPDELPLGPAPFAGRGALVYREPRGVLGVVPAEADPLASALGTAVPALMAGNAVVLRPSARSLRTASLVATLFERVVPAGLVSVLGPEPELDGPFLDAVDAVIVEGRVDEVQAWLGLCASAARPCFARARAPGVAFVLAGADLGRAADALAWAAFSGAMRGSPLRLAFVARAQVDALLARLEAAASAAAREGGAPGWAEGGRARRLELSALAADAALGSGLDGASLSIVAIDDPEAALAALEPLPPLGFVSVWSGDRTLAEALARTIDAPIVGLDELASPAALAALPWSGPGAGAHRTLAELTRARLVVPGGRRAQVGVAGFPYTPAWRALARALAVAAGPAGWLRRLRALWTLGRVLPRRWWRG
ncbi:MAG: aldehyde dehydrogenase family protein [Polyangiaceae bacterium]|jgi:acyl-CoA reductase-like NAD-dependent aldehyde dehydrogenase|nr:aldehyde dehydrogenase family protein [Polyangiaceae bacterium]